MRNQTLAIALIALLGSSISGFAMANTVEEHGASFDRAIALEGESLALSGTGVARYRIVFTVYAAGLYLPAQTQADEVLDSDTPRVLEIEYFHDISAEDIIRAADTKLAQQLPTDARSRLQPLVDEFHALYQQVSDGDRYRMAYTPGKGTQLSFNGQPVGTITGGEFAAAYFGIWLDPEDPLSRNLRNDLMAGLAN